MSYITLSTAMTIGLNRIAITWLYRICKFQVKIKNFGNVMMEQIKEETQKKQDNRGIKDCGDSLKKHKAQKKLESKDDLNRIQVDRGDIRSKKETVKTHKLIVDKSKTVSKAVENVIKLEENTEEPKGVNEKREDRGDSFKKHKAQNKNESKEDDLNRLQADKGDIRSKKEIEKSHKSIVDKSKTNSKAIENFMKLEENEEPKGGHDKRNLLLNNVNQIIVNNMQTKEKLELDRRRRIREKYTIKYNSVNNLKRDENDKNRTVGAAEFKIEESAKTPVNINRKQLNEAKQPQELTGTKTDRELDAIRVARKKPHIETSVARSDHVKTYKTITFVEPKPNKTTSLQIDILREYAKPKLSIGANTIKANTKTIKLNVEEKPPKRRKPSHKTKRIRKFRKAMSPDSRRVASPITEVAKWAPNSLNHLTKPYYEAWVNTTLAAINKGSKMQEFTKKQMQKLVTGSIISIPGDITNEMFTGRIKIRHKAN